MALEVTQKYVAPSRLPILNIRWGPVFAGLAVGISVNLFLLLVGGAAGLAAFDPNSPPSGKGLIIAAGMWDTICMIAGAFVGGYVAARASGMRRSRDGLLYGAVSWGVTMILSAILAGSAAGASLAGMFSAVSARPNEAAAVARSAQSGDRQETVTMLQNRMGLTEDQANRVVDQALALAGQSDKASEQGKSDVKEGLRTASLTSGWLSAAILLSLIAALGGGTLGAKGGRRLGGPELRRELMHAENPMPPESTAPHVPL